MAFTGHPTGRRAARAVLAVITFGALLASGTPALAARGADRDRSAAGAANSGFVATAAPSRGARANAIPDPDGELPGCNAFVRGSAKATLTRVPQPPGVPDELVARSDILAWGEFECVGLLYLSGQARIIDRTPGYNGLVLADGNLVQRCCSATAGINGSAASTVVYDEWQDNGRSVEGILELTMQLRYGYTWQSCTPPFENRLLRCDGLGTTTLYAMLGTYPINTGLKPPYLRYVALGDSFASGVNAGDYDAESVPGDCLRSSNAYSRRLTGLYRGGLQILTPLLRGCSGAVIADMTGTQLGSEGPQINAVNPRSTRLVTVHIGGNDLGFGPILRACVLETGPCVAPLVPEATVQATQTRLTALYRQILARMRSDATLVVLTYPAVLPRPGEPTCLEVNTFFTAAELTAIDQAWARARQMILSAASAVGDARVRVLDLHDAFAGHKICSSAPWASIEILFNRDHSFHPNAAGHRAIAQRLQAFLGLTGVV